jgi:hypothetical protein
MLLTLNYTGISATIPHERSDRLSRNGLHRMAGCKSAQPDVGINKTIHPYQRSGYHSHDERPLREESCPTQVPPENHQGREGALRAESSLCERRKCPGCELVERKTSRPGSFRKGGSDVRGQLYFNLHIRLRFRLSQVNCFFDCPGQFPSAQMRCVKHFLTGSSAEVDCLPAILVQAR